MTQTLTLSQNTAQEPGRRPRHAVPTWSDIPTLYRVQRAIDWLLLVPFCGLIALTFRFYGRYRIKNHREVRKRFAEITEVDGPILLCGNHLTFIDSAIMIWAFGSLGWYIRHYNRFMWNTPAGDVFAKNPIYRAVGYLSKCIFLYRDRPARHKAEIFGTVRTLVALNELVTIFPEGRRSRTGRVEADRLTQGAAKLALQVPGTRILCVYLRSQLQETYGRFPPKGSEFEVLFDLLEPHLDSQKSTPAELTQKLGKTLASLEEEYFRRNPGRPVGHA